MGNLCGTVKRSFVRNMCLGAHNREEIQRTETVEGQQEEVGVFDGDTHSSLIDYLHAVGDYDDLPAAEGEPDLVWVFGGDGQWHLCAECTHCCALMTYPGSPHNCPEGDIFDGPVVTLPALFASATSLELEGRNLECEEVLEPSDSDRDYTSSLEEEVYALGQDLD